MPIPNQAPSPDPQSVSFQLEGDQVYSLSFDFNQICEAETVARCNLMTALAGGGITALQTRALLYACLKTAHPQVLLSEAGWLLSQDMPKVLAALAQVLTEARSEDVAEDSAPEVQASAQPEATPVPSDGSPAE